MRLGTWNLYQDLAKIKFSRMVIACSYFSPETFLNNLTYRYIAGSEFFVFHSVSSVVLPWPREKWPATWWKTTCPTAPPWDGFSLPWNALQATINAPAGGPSDGGWCSGCSVDSKVYDLLGYTHAIIINNLGWSSNQDLYKNMGMGQYL